MSNGFCRTNAAQAPHPGPGLAVHGGEHGGFLAGAVAAGC